MGRCRRIRTTPGLWRQSHHFHRYGWSRRTAAASLMGNAELSRQEAVSQVKAWLHDRRHGQANYQDRVHHLVGLFDLQPEELAEAGVAYETLRGMEDQHLWNAEPVSVAMAEAS